ncbi:MAG: 2-dehydropantoate 2-reductase [Vulcanimicrobiaceae bacterium]
MRIAVLGAGAIGGFIAGMLARAQTDVSVIARGAHLESIGARGLTVRSEAGNFTVKIPAAADLRELGIFDTVLVAVKAHQLAGVLEQLAPSCAAGATIVPMQNGVPFWYFSQRTVQAADPGGLIRRAIPRSQIVGCVIHASGNTPRPGEVEQSGGMQYFLGDPDEKPSSRVAAVAALLAQSGMNAPVPSSLRLEVWRKLLGNASLNPVSALTRLPIGPMLRHPGTRALVAALMQETLAVASATGIEANIDIDDRIAFAARLEGVKTSMLQDVEAKRPLELDPIVGAVVELAAAFGVSAPTLHTIYSLTYALQRSYLPR